MACSCWGKGRTVLHTRNCEELNLVLKTVRASFNQAAKRLSNVSAFPFPGSPETTSLAQRAKGIGLDLASGAVPLRVVQPGSFSRRRAEWRCL